MKLQKFCSESESSANLKFKNNGKQQSTKQANLAW